MAIFRSVPSSEIDTEQAPASRWRLPRARLDPGWQLAIWLMVVLRVALGLFGFLSYRLLPPTWTGGDHLVHHLDRRRAHIDDCRLLAGHPGLDPGGLQDVEDELLEPLPHHWAEPIGEYVKLKKSGAQNFSGLCPFHQEKTPSFSVHATRQFYHCFGCGISGDVFSFVQKLENITFPEAVRAVAERCGIPVPKLAPASPAEAKEAQLRAKLLDLNERAAMFFEEQLRKPEAAGLAALGDLQLHERVRQQLPSVPDPLGDPHRAAERLAEEEAAVRRERQPDRDRDPVDVDGAARRDDLAVVGDRRVGGSPSGGRGGRPWRWRSRRPW